MIDVVNLLDAWIAALWCASWQGGLVALAVWSVCQLAPSIPARFQAWLWRLVFVKFIVALAWSAPLEVPLLPASSPTASLPTMWEPSLAAQQGSLAAEAGSVVEPRVLRALSPWSVPFLVWIAFVGWQAARIVAACRHARRLRHDCRPCENQNLIEELARLSRSAGLGSPPRLLETDGPGSPLLLGIFRPAIVLPATTLDRLDHAERALVLGHELAHVRRADLFWSVVAAVARSLFCFHPLAWLAERQLRLTQEIAADELAIALERRDPVSYATILVSVIGKLGPARLLPTMSVGIAGSHQSLQQRFAAMRFMKPVSRRVVAVYGIVLAAVAVPAVVPWRLVAADAPAADKASPTTGTAEKSESAGQPNVVQMTQTGRGKFVSFQDGTLTVRSRSGEIWAWTNLAATTPALRYDPGIPGFKPMNLSEALDQAKPDAWIQVIVEKGKPVVRVGERKGATIGTFVSFKDQRLLMLSKNLGGSYAKKYGNQVHFNKFFPNVPVYESVDGGAYQLIGTAEKVLGEVKEGTILTVHGEGDDNITRIEIGVLKAP